MKKILILLFVIFAISIGTQSCNTIELPGDLDRPELSESSQENEAVLIAQDIRWRLWSNDARRIAGTISKREHEKRRDYLLSVLDMISE